MIKNIFDLQVAHEIIDRINLLSNETPAKWGKMSVGQMLAHCNVTYEMTFTDKHPKPGVFKGLLLKLIVKKMIVNDKSYKKNLHTAPAFIITSEKEFETEKSRLIAHILQTQALGKSHFDGKISHSFGAMTAQEWNNLFYKHLDHHLTQFGV